MKTQKQETKSIAANLPKYPFYFRLPPPGQVDPWFQLNRSAWNALILPSASNNFSAPIDSISTGAPSKKRGIRLVVFASAKAYFDNLYKEQVIK
jgi:hypothetical protein